MHKKVNKTETLVLTRGIRRDKAGSIIKVRPGYAENYLIPNGYAIRLKGNEEFIKSKMSEWEKQDKQLQKEAESLLEKLKELNLVIKAESGIGGSLYGSVSSSTVEKELASLGLKIARKDITMNPIKLLGDYKIKVNLHGGNTVELPLSVVPAGS